MAKLYSAEGTVYQQIAANKNATCIKPSHNTLHRDGFEGESVRHRRWKASVRIFSGGKTKLKIERALRNCLAVRLRGLFL